MSTEYSCYSYRPGELPPLPPRTPRSNKGTYGRVLLVCGSCGMAGAAFLAGKAAYRTGAGLVELFTPEENRVILQTLLPEAVLTIYPQECTKDNDRTELIRSIRRSLDRADAVVVGCGLGTGDTAKLVVQEVLMRRNLPCTADADALNLVAANPALENLLSGRIITPHPGEMSRLTGLPISKILENPAACATEYARRVGCICVLKDHRTAVADGSGKVFCNTTGNSGMATGGSGDVLAGILGGLMAQGRDGTLTLADTAALGVYLHGLAGDLAATKLGEYSLMSSDILDYLPDALRACMGK